MRFIRWLIEVFSGYRFHCKMNINSFFRRENTLNLGVQQQKEYKDTGMNSGCLANSHQPRRFQSAPAVPLSNFLIGMERQVAGAAA